MPGEVILHIGDGKTGTTTIQNFCYQNRETLAEAGILYPQIGLFGAAHHVLGQKWGGWLHEAALEESPDAAWSRLADLVARHEGRILISSESCAALTSEPEGLERLRFVKESLKAARITIIGYTRDYAELVESSYKEFVRNRKFHGTIADWVDHLAARDEPTDGIWEKFQTVFGKENVIIKAYDSSPEGRRRHVHGFLATFGVDIDDGVWQMPPDQNLSISAATAVLLTDPRMADLAASAHFRAAVSQVLDAKSYPAPGQKRLLNAALRARVSQGREDASGAAGDGCFDPDLEQFSLNDIIALLAALDGAPAPVVAGPLEAEAAPVGAKDAPLPPTGEPVGLLARCDYLTHLALSKIPFATRSFKERFGGAARRRWRAEYGPRP